MSGILMLISDFLSLITIILCFVLKVPQIIKLYKAGNAEGISVFGLLLELSSYTVTMMYNYTNDHALMSYLEYPIIIIQEYILISLVLYYNKYSLKVFLSVFGISLSVMFAFAFGIFSKVILTFLVPLTIPSGSLSKILQLMAIIMTKSASSVSALTWFLSFFTNVTRIYTIFLDSADVMLLLNFSISSILSGSILVASLYYQRRGVSASHKVK